MRVATGGCLSGGTGVSFPSWTDGGRAPKRSQSGSGAGVALSTVPTHPRARIDSQLFRVLLSRRLRLPPPLAQRFYRCDHCAACVRAGVLAKRFFALESAAARVCCEAGAWVTTNVMKSSPTGCLSTVEHSWWWTPHSSRLCSVTASLLPT